MLGYVVVILAIVGLFTVQRCPAITFAIWTCTNGYWMTANFNAGNNDQGLMFTAFVIASAIQFWRNLP